MSTIQIKNLSFEYEGNVEKVFENVSLNIDTNWKLGLIGRNGKGKTTFLKLLKGEYSYQGTIQKVVEIDYFPFEVKNKEEITIELVKNIIPQIEDWEIIKELNLLNADAEILYRKYSLLSSGEQVKVLLISLFLKENNFLLIDEPTNHVDYETKKEIANYLKTKKGFILVSHDRELLNNVVDHILSINNKNITIQKGNYNTWKEEKEKEDNFEIDKNEKLEKDISRLETASRNVTIWSDKVEKTKMKTKNSREKIDRGYIGHQSAKMMQRAKNIENRKNKQIEEKESLLKNIEIIEDLTMKPQDFDKKTLIVANNFQIKYSEKPLFSPQNFVVEKNDRIAIIGKNGSGKSSILKILTGQNIPYEGKISIANNLKISYVPQTTEEVTGLLSEYAKKYDIEGAIFRAMLNKLGMQTKKFERDISNTSEGQKKKIMLARSITEKAHIYIWDEPLNYIDIISREQIEKMLLKIKPTILFVEHDKTFVNAIATKKIII